MVKLGKAIKASTAAAPKNLGKEETLAVLRRIEAIIKKGKTVPIKFLGGPKVILEKICFPKGFKHEVVMMTMKGTNGPLQFLISNTIFKSKVDRAIVKYVYNEEKDLYVLRVVDFGETDLLMFNE